MKKKLVYYLLICYLAVQVFTIVSCGKNIENISSCTNTNNPIKSYGGDTIASWTLQDGFTYQNSFDEIITIGDSALTKLYGDTLSLEFFGILDSLPITDNCIPMVQTSFFDSYLGKSTNVFITIVKEIVDNNKVIYKSKGNGHAPVTIICKQANCNNDCRVVPSTVDKNGKVLAWRCHCSDPVPFFGLGTPHHCEQCSANEGTTKMQVITLSGIDIPIPRN